MHVLSLVDQQFVAEDSYPGKEIAPFTLRCRDNELVLYCRLVNLDNLQVDVKSDRVTIYGHRGGFHAELGVVDRITGSSFTRTTHLPRPIDPGSAQANYVNGVLYLHLPLTNQVNDSEQQLYPTW